MSSVNQRDHAPTAAAYGRPTLESGDPKLTPNYAYPITHKALQEEHRHPVQQPSLSEEQSRQPLPTNHYTYGDVSFEMTGPPSRSQGRVDYPAQPGMPSSSSQASNLRISTDLNSDAGPSRSRQNSNQYQQQPTTRAQPAQSSSSPAAHSRQTSQATTVGVSTYGASHVQQVSPYPMRQPVQSRVFGLAKDLRPQTGLMDPAFFPGGVIPPEAATLNGADNTKDQPTFSVELFATSFDHRGYPVYGGRAALIRGVVRMHEKDQANVNIRVSANTTSGSAAAVWDGVALQPVENGSEREAFANAETFTAAEGSIEHVGNGSPATPQETSLGASSADNSNVFAVPFAINLPVGQNTRIVDGQVERSYVSLPPSFEMSSEQDNREKATLRNTGNAGTIASGAASVKTSRTKMTAITLRDAVETGLQQVYRIGCFYRITITLSKPEGADKDRKLSGFFSRLGKNKEKRGSDHLSIPIVFAGEVTSNAPLPTSLPQIPPAILKEPSVPLADGWISERAHAKWSGMLFRSVKRGVELELFLPGTTLQAPSLVPFLLVIRPEDPDMLPQFLPVGQGLASGSHPGSPRPGVFRHDANDSDHAGGAGRPSLSVPRRTGASPAASPVSSPGIGDYSHRQLGSHLESQEESQDQEEEVMRSSEENTYSKGGSLSKLLRSSLSMARNKEAGSQSSQSSPTEAPLAAGRDAPHGKQPRRQTSRSTFTFSRRPNTAPSRSSSEGSGAGTEASFTVRGGASSSGAGSGGATDLPGLLRVSLVQNVYYSSSNVNDPPKNKRKLISVADVEEVDLDKVTDGRDSCFLPSPGMLGTLAESKGKGVRVLRGLLRVGREAVPSFRVQSIEVKYAVKVDLLPFNMKANKGHGRSSNPSSSPPRTPPSRPSMHSTLGSASAANTLTPSTSASGFGQSHPTGASPSSGSNAANWSPTQADASRQSHRGTWASTQPSVAGHISEAGWTRRSPSDQTVLATENSKVHKSTGSLWIGVRMVKGRGSL